MLSLEVVCGHLEHQPFPLMCSSNVSCLSQQRLHFWAHHLCTSLSVPVPEPHYQSLLLVLLPSQIVPDLLKVTNADASGDSVSPNFLQTAHLKTAIFQFCWFFQILCLEKKRILRGWTEASLSPNLYVLKIISLPIHCPRPLCQAPWLWGVHYLSTIPLGFSSSQTLAAAFPPPPTPCVLRCVVPQASSHWKTCWGLCYICFVSLTTFLFSATRKVSTWYAYGRAPQMAAASVYIPRVSLSCFLPLPERLFKVSKGGWPRLLSNHCFCPGS